MNDDLIRRGELAEEVRSLTVYVNGLRAGKGVLQEYAKQYRDSLLRIIDEQPAVGAVEVVRCKDCIFKKPPQLFGSAIIGEMRCSILGTPMNFNDFCSYGERREDDANLE